jgi:hypothetical protein
MPLFKVQQNNQIMLFSDNCVKYGSVTVGNNGTRLTVTGATPGAEYVLSVKYDAKSIQGATFVGQPPMLTYSWDATITNGGTSPVPDSHEDLDVTPGCSDTTPIAPYCEMPKSGDLTDIQASQLPETVEPTVSCMQVYPNPSSGIVNFEFSINESAKATLELLTATGQKVATIFNENIEAGMVQKVIYTNSLATGVYVYTLKWNDQKLTGKLIITR